LEVRDAVKGMNHGGTYGSGSIGKGSVPACNRSQSAISSDLTQLGPRLHQSSLPPWEAAGEQLYGV
jgi:hypothetical protein